MTPVPKAIDVSFLLLSGKQDEPISKADLSLCMFENLDAKAHVDDTIFRDYPQESHGGSLSLEYRQALVKWLKAEKGENASLDKKRDSDAWNHEKQFVFSHGDLVAYFYGSAVKYKQLQVTFYSYFSKQ